MSETASLIETIAKHDMFSVFSRLLSTSGTDEIFSHGGEFTMLAPTNDAFGKIADRQMETLQAQMEPLNRQMQQLSAVMEAHSKDMESAHQPMEDLSRQMQEASKPMEALGQQMDVLGKIWKPRDCVD